MATSQTDMPSHSCRVSASSLHDYRHSLRTCVFRSRRIHLDVRTSSTLATPRSPITTHHPWRHYIGHCCRSCKRSGLLGSACILGDKSYRSFDVTDAGTALRDKMDTYIPCTHTNDDSNRLCAFLSGTYYHTPVLCACDTTRPAQSPRARVAFAHHTVIVIYSIF